MVWTEKAENNKHMNNAQDYYGIDGCPSAHIYMNIPKIDHLNLSRRAATLNSHCRHYET